MQTVVAGEGMDRPMVLQNDVAMGRHVTDDAIGLPHPTPETIHIWSRNTLKFRSAFLSSSTMSSRSTPQRLLTTYWSESTAAS